MIVDSSPIIAIFLKEEGYIELLRKIYETQEPGIGAPTLVETGIVLSAKLGRDQRGALYRFLVESNIVSIPFTEAHMNVAIGSWLKFGKSRHPAKLNFGDCLTYAVAKVANLPLLFVGKDFEHTDLVAA